jgi:hypothetical protein
MEISLIHKIFVGKTVTFQTLWKEMELFDYLTLNTEAESCWPVVYGQMYFQSYVVTYILCCAMFECTETDII